MNGYREYIGAPDDDHLLDVVVRSISEFDPQDWVDGWIGPSEIARAVMSAIRSPARSRPISEHLSDVSDRAPDYQETIRPWLWPIVPVLDIDEWRAVYRDAKIKS